jgi:hypothetical protein
MKDLLLNNIYEFVQGKEVVKESTLVILKPLH